MALMALEKMEEMEVDLAHQRLGPSLLLPLNAPSSQFPILVQARQAKVTTHQQKEQNANDPMEDVTVFGDKEQNQDVHRYRFPFSCSFPFSPARSLLCQPPGIQIRSCEHQVLLVKDKSNGQPGKKVVSSLNWMWSKWRRIHWLSIGMGHLSPCAYTMQWKKD